MASVVIEETLVAKSGVIRIGLIEYVGVSARRALDDRALNKGLFPTRCSLRLTRMS